MEKFCLSVLAELLHGFNHFLLKRFQCAGFAEIEAFSSRVLRQILEMKGPFTVG